jgi:molybdopterin/thiamine biosynthesis adenylyltransferase
LPILHADACSSSLPNSSPEVPKKGRDDPSNGNDRQQPNGENALETGHLSAGYDRHTIFCRMPELVNFDDLDRLATKTVAIAGCGAIGFTNAECLVRMGLGRIKISDFDRFGPENVSRQLGATVETMGRRKVEVLKERLQAINPAIAIHSSDGIAPEMLGEFLEGVDIVCDCVDFFAMDARRLLHREARNRAIPLVLAAPAAFGCTLQIFDKSGASLDDFFDLRDENTEQENLSNFERGINPARLARHYHRSPDLRVGKRGAVSAGCLLASSLASTAVIRRLLGQPVSMKSAPYLYAVDLVLSQFIEMRIPRGVTAIKESPDRYTYPQAAGVTMGAAKLATLTLGDTID